ncbi:carboxypeptidase-like regulatory domain-containing protein [Pontibacter fetidus]|uniref:Carboxypeptidase regulatory-like domain-containing protein n=1 Tax=Pontibacter fetidus TaxID=2700082 RepID=A0A6B2H656_9BACT|nr:carboxypeptidase-like regulatory domain-containing protein [Pontibacter fetidus]NDK54554.1 carboxypeptidase regulatory-like domain-containing protein [Pontibacter fetidus]
MLTIIVASPVLQETIEDPLFKLMKSFLKPTALSVLLLAFFAFALTGCEREPDSGPHGEGINGNVQIYNAYGEAQDPSGVTVTIEQTGRTTKTDSEGAYVLPYLASGNYSLKFAKEGHPTTFVHNVEHVRTKHTSTPVPIARMIEPSAYFVTQASVAVNKNQQNNPYYSITGKLNKAVPAGKEIQLKLYLGKNAAVSLSDYVHMFSYKVSGQEFQINYPYFASLIINNEMQHGDTVYMVLFTDAIVEDACDGKWQKPDCTNSSTLNSTNPIVFSETIP